MDVYMAVGFPHMYMGKLYFMSCKLDLKQLLGLEDGT